MDRYSSKSKNPEPTLMEHLLHQIEPHAEFGDGHFESTTGALSVHPSIASGITAMHNIVYI